MKHWKSHPVHVGYLIADCDHYVYEFNIETEELFIDFDVCPYNYLPEHLYNELKQYNYIERN
jgi:hypothetical protein